MEGDGGCGSFVSSMCQLYLSYWCWAACTLQQKRQIVTSHPLHMCSLAIHPGQCQGGKEPSSWLGTLQSVTFPILSSPEQRKAGKMLLQASTLGLALCYKYGAQQRGVKFRTKDNTLHSHLGVQATTKINCTLVSRDILGLSLWAVWSHGWRN